ncbi:glycerol-3-phosphate 1-O-acyltransferase PlsY [Phenylobacterium montanum]|uniref:Glycerol-3-phosphate acyltransferase n=1 Tax=Phenylobacterium montanum TaxID=2823693 RepID=A0A975FZL9_9CAUL|nr:glycerol-3-phosphate 1-O-acyltransferase PlsY [Caulobacter sp. S6]QUD88195.1 glycerol-3-phosphate 1-O-acyltransferase PlsY [Caulobacter sp. S6]
MPAGLTPVAIAVVLLGGYLLGSIPFGLIATRLGGAGDIRKVGSGNIGATNVLRTGRRDLALITLLGDGGKAAVAALLARFFIDRIAPGADPLAAASMAGAAAFLGHCFPVWLGFKGGKGVATFFGTLFAVAWPVGLLAGATWIAVAVIFRISSLGALAAAALAPLFALALHSGYPVVVMAVFLAVLIYIRHHENIARLLKGQEPKIGAKKAAEAAQAE